MSELIEINKIKLDSGTQSRERICNETVQEYVSLMLADEILPPINVMTDGSSYYIYDGFHRCLAAVKNKYTSIRAIIEKGTMLDAKRKSWSVNDKHGLKRSNADKRKIISDIALDAEYSQYSSRDLSIITKISHTFIAKVRAELKNKEKERAPKEIKTNKSDLLITQN